MVICIFEDNNYVNFFPLTYTRPVFELKLGLSSLIEKILKEFKGQRIVLHCRPELQAITNKKNKKILINRLPKTNSCLFINGRAIISTSLAKKLVNTKTDKLFVNQQEIIAAYLSGKNLIKIKLNKKLDFAQLKLPRQKIKADLIKYPWELISLNERRIIQESQASGLLGKIKGTVYPNATLLNKKNIYLAETAIIKSGSVIDAESGPVFIDQGVVISPNCTIVGPTYLGQQTIINSGARILAGTSIGPVCKIGGEVAESIIHGYTNKQHGGFLGHAYLGEWCNLGANTNNSDLKNNYGQVEVIINGQKINTGQQFVGLFMGDHSKSGINTMFNTGTVVGVGCNVYGAGYLPKYIPSFTWLDAQKKPLTYQFEKFAETAKAVCRRRNINFITSYKNMFKNIFKHTSIERKSYEKK